MTFRESMRLEFKPNSSLMEYVIKDDWLLQSNKARMFCLWSVLGLHTSINAVDKSAWLQFWLESVTIDADLFEFDIYDEFHLQLTRVFVSFY